MIPMINETHWHEEGDLAKEARELLESLSVSMDVKLVGDNCPPFCPDHGKYFDEIGVYPRKHHVHGKHYVVRLKRGDQTFITDFWSSYTAEEYRALGCQKYRNGETAFKYGKYKHTDERGHITERPRKAPFTVTPYDLITCLERDDPGTLVDFCDSYGYDTDSGKARHIYDAVVTQFCQLRRFFSADELAKLSEIS
jgi:hypothetical protein